MAWIWSIPLVQAHLWIPSDPILNPTCWNLHLLDQILGSWYCIVLGIPTSIAWNIHHNSCSQICKKHRTIPFSFSMVFFFIFHQFCLLPHCFFFLSFNKHKTTHTNYHVRSHNSTQMTFFFNKKNYHKKVLDLVQLECMKIQFWTTWKQESLDLEQCNDKIQESLNLDSRKSRNLTQDTRFERTRNRSKQKMLTFGVFRRGIIKNHKNTKNTKRNMENYTQQRETKTTTNSKERIIIKGYI